MTIAQRMREITNGAQADKQKNRINEHKKYVSKLVDTKVHKAAMKGNSRVEIKIDKHFVPSLTIEEFASRGFDMTQSKLANGKIVLTVKW